MGRGGRNVETEQQQADSSEHESKNEQAGLDFYKKQSEAMSSQTASKTFYNWSEIAQHNKKGDIWIVINDNVYDVSKFQSKHPGGSRIMSLYAGQDASEVFNAFHKDYNKVYKYSKMYHVGKVSPGEKTIVQSDDKRSSEILKDFSDLRHVAKEMNLFKPSYTFFLLHGGHILLLQFLAYYLIWNYGPSLIPCTIALICQITAMSQAGWAQHDYGHSSFLFNARYNKYIQMIFIGLIKGASQAWWNNGHFQHHAKPNVINKDPDISADPIFVLGETQAKQKAERNIKKKEPYLYSYTYQHWYFPIGAALLFPAFFMHYTIKYAIQKRYYLDLASIVPMYALFFYVTLTSLGFWNTLIYFTLLKLIESCWFTWVTQVSHIAMDIHDEDPTDTWVSMQLRATCNITKSQFNDWFTGHLNFQIEHHLFPTMPRHNLYKIQPLVQSLCKKHQIPYVIKPLGQAFLDILLSLKKNGALWREAFDELRDAEHSFDAAEKTQ